jgi:hypothetical protein
MFSKQMSAMPAFLVRLVKGARRSVVPLVDIKRSTHSDPAWRDWRERSSNGSSLERQRSCKLNEEIDMMAEENIENAIRQKLYPSETTSKAEAGKKELCELR